MSDFDDVLERLLVDTGFQAQLAANPAAALAGYRLSADEVELLQAQVTGDAGGNQQVEQRTSKASMFGLISSFGGVGASVHDLISPQHGAGGSGGLGEALPAGQGGQGVGEFHESSYSSFSQASSSSTTGYGGLGESSQGAYGSLAEAAAQPGGGTPAPFTVVGHTAGGGLIGQNLHAGAGLPIEPDQTGVAPAGGPVGGAPTDGYHARVDWNGDGKWDAHTYVNRADGGVDIVVDANHDGKADFVGHDINRDGLIDSSEIDTNHDGVMDVKYVDLNGDGWLDKEVK